MESPHDPSAPTTESAGQPADGSPVSADSLSSALGRLVERGVLNQAQAGSVLVEIGALPDQPRPQSPRRLLGEIAGYLGASFVVGATLLFLGDKWEELGRMGRLSILAAMAAILFGSGLAVRWRAAPPDARWWRPWRGDDVRSRLSSTLMTAAAAAAGFATYVGLVHTEEYAGTVVQPPVEFAPFVAALVGLAVVSVGYLLARSALGQLGMAVAAFVVYATLLELVNVWDTGALGLGTLVLGAGWAALAWRRLVAERRFGLAIAVTFALIGAQTLAFGDSTAENYLGYALTALAAAACFLAYTRVREWIVLAGGVAGTTAVVPEFLHDVTNGSLNASGLMLVAGVTLLAGGLAGLRISRSPEIGHAATAPNGT